MVKIQREDEAADTAALASRLFPDQRLRFEKALIKPHNYADSAWQRERLRQVFSGWKGEDVIRQRSENMAGGQGAKDQSDRK